MRKRVFEKKRRRLAACLPGKRRAGQVKKRVVWGKKERLRHVSRDNGGQARLKKRVLEKKSACGVFPVITVGRPG